MSLVTWNPKPVNPFHVCITVLIAMMKECWALQLGAPKPSHADWRGAEAKDTLPGKHAKISCSRGGLSSTLHWYMCSKNLLGNIYERNTFQHYPLIILPGVHNCLWPQNQLVIQIQTCFEEIVDNVLLHLELTGLGGVIVLGLHHWVGLEWSHQIVVQR